MGDNPIPALNERRVELPSNNVELGLAKTSENLSRPTSTNLIFSISGKQHQPSWKCRG